MTKLMYLLATAYVVVSLALLAPGVIDLLTYIYTGGTVFGAERSFIAFAAFTCFMPLAPLLAEVLDD